MFASNRRPLRKSVGNLAGTGDWYLVRKWVGSRYYLTEQGTAIAVRAQEIGGRAVLSGPYETKRQALDSRPIAEVFHALKGGK